MYETLPLRSLENFRLTILDSAGRTHDRSPVPTLLAGYRQPHFGVRLSLPHLYVCPETTQVLGVASLGLLLVLYGNRESPFEEGLLNLFTGGAAKRPCSPGVIGMTQRAVPMTQELKGKFLPTPSYTTGRWYFWVTG